MTQESVPFRRAPRTARAGAAVLVAALVFPACTHNAPPATPEQRGETALAPRAENPAAPAAPLPVEAELGVRTLLELLPASSQFAVGLNMQLLRSSQLFAEVMPYVREQYGKALTTIENRCSLDPFAALHIVLLGGRMSGDKPTLVASGLSRDTFATCLRRMAAAEGRTVDIHDDGHISRVKQGSDTVWMGWSNTVTAVTGMELDRAAIEERLAGKNPLSGNKGMMALVDRVATEAGFWMVIDLRQQGGGMPGIPMEVFATVEFHHGLGVRGGMGMRSPSDATLLDSRIGQWIQSLKSGDSSRFLARLRHRVAGSEIVIELDLDETELSELIGELLDGRGIGGILGF